MAEAALHNTQDNDDASKRGICTSAYLQAASSGDAELLEWLLARWRALVDLQAVDDNGSPALVLAVLFGHSDCARILVETGVDPNARDARGWTALHFACQLANIPLASYLLNHRADPDVMSLKGLKPADLARKAKDGDVILDMLSAVQEARSPEIKLDPAGHTNGTSRTLKNHQIQLNLAAESVQNLNVNLESLCLKPEPSPFLSSDADSFHWDSCHSDEMLVFSHQDLPLIFSLICHVPPLRSRAQRIIPASVLFLCARYATHYSASEDLLNTLLDGAIDEIEAQVQANSQNIALIAFWLYNITLLLHFLRQDPHINGVSDYNQGQLEGLINELVVWIIRDAERRIDKILDAALLDYEALPGFENVRFEGEWNLLKSLTGGHKRKESYPRASVMSLFGAQDTGQQRSFSSATPPASMQSKPRKLQRHSVANLRSPEIGHPSSSVSPKDVTSLLSSTLFVLQLYELHPSIVVQCLSQIFYWLACECFNRILTRRKYLARSKAIQIRLNVSALEEWARHNNLPVKLVQTHFRPLNQLLQWLQCLSTAEETLDNLVGAIQQRFFSLNILQLRKALSTYRYEVDEGRMLDECVDYLAQVQQDWEKRQIRQAVEEAQTESETKQLASSQSSDEEAELQRYMSSTEYKELKAAKEELARSFSYPDAFQSYNPPGAPPCTGELLNSRYMLPFALSEELVSTSSRPSFGPLSVPTNQQALELEASLPRESTGHPYPTPVLPEDFHDRLDSARFAKRQESNSYNGLGLEEHASLASFDWRRRMEEELGESDEEEGGQDK